MPNNIQHAFAEKGVEVVAIPMNRTVFQPHQSLEYEYDWIFFTSVNAVKYFDFTQLNRQAKILAIGNQTTKTLRKLGYPVDFQPKEGFSEGLVEEWLRLVGSKQRVFWPHSFQARRVIYNALTRQGHVVLEQVIYRNEFFSEDQKRLRQLITNETIHYVLFASPSAWNSFSKTVGTIKRLPENFWAQLTIAAIGPVTARVIEKEQHVAIQPDIYDMPHLYDCLLRRVDQENGAFL
ncbi:uroporphyrinogen-III synthase [Enterococcus raffinosus]|uniref:uroporphyrinogen-III synthase n=1 Tax=Enterococcus raffinosus TaxID=71452 RepID=UPI001C11A77D|nr:uroporphyrinogen-III synthase [Enterococcus raffinosus]MBU5360349.1 uroporphyrinogen-III synthase [Enterococcus raffinosus]